MRIMVAIALSAGLASPPVPTSPLKPRDTWPMTVELALKLYVAANPVGVCGTLETPERMDLCQRAVARQSLEAAAVMVEMLEKQRR